MAKVRVSTTVDERLLAQVRQLAPQATDAAILERAFLALLAQHRRSEIDEAYRAAYATHPIDEPDAWGDLGSFGDAAAAS